MCECLVENDSFLRNTSFGEGVIAHICSANLGLELLTPRVGTSGVFICFLSTAQLAPFATLGEPEKSGVTGGNCELWC